MQGPTIEERNAQVTTALPAALKVKAIVRRDNGVLVVDVSPEIEELKGTSIRNALAQIVYTAYEFGGLTGVLVTVNGVPGQWPTPVDGQTDRPLTVFDYPGVLEWSQPDFPNAIVG